MQEATIAREEGTAEHPWLAVATVCIGAAMAAIDASIVTVALPTIHTYFHVKVGAIIWISLAYLLALTTVVVLAGRLADSLGRSRMYRGGFLVFTVASVGCGLAPSLPILIISRVIQGVGAAMLQANSVAIVTSAVPKAMRGRAIGIQGAAQAVGLSIGPALGGVLIGAFHWQSIFLVNLPIGVVALLISAYTLPKDAHTGSDRRVDFISTAFLAIALSLVLFALNPSSPGRSLWWIELLAGFVIAYFFARRQSRVPDPLVHPEVVRIPAVTWGIFLGLLSFAVLYGTLFLAPFYLQEVRHLPATEFGLMLSTVALAMTAVAPVAGSLADRYGNQVMSVAGLIAAALGSVLLMMWTTGTAFAWTIPSLVLIGAGAGIFTPPNNSSVMGAAPTHHLGVTGGLLNMGRSVGMIAGSALAAGVYEAYSASRLGGPYHGFKMAAVALVAVAIVNLILQWLRPKDVPGRPRAATGPIHFD